MKIEIKFRNHKRRCRQAEAKHLSKKTTVRKLVRKAVPGWKRAAYHRIRVMMPALSQKRAKKLVDLTKLGAPWSSDEDWKNFRKGMKKDGPTALTPLYTIKKDHQRKKRYNRRRKIRRQLTHTDQVAAQHNMLPNSTRRQTKQKDILVLQDTAHLNLCPGLGYVRMYLDQRSQITVVEQLVPQLMKIVMEQVGLHEASTKQSVADLHEAMGIPLDAPLKKRKTRRGHMGNRENRAERIAPVADQPRYQLSRSPPQHGRHCGQLESDRLWERTQVHPMMKATLKSNGTL